MKNEWDGGTLGPDLTKEELIQFMRDYGMTDVVPVIRCVNCKWFDITEPSGTVEPIMFKCKRRQRFVESDDFCKYVERREE